MRKLYFATVALALGACAFLQCSDDDDAVTPAPDGGQDRYVPPPPPADSGVIVTNVDVTEHITADTTWTADHTYTLKGPIFVQSGTLTIQPGVKILGDNPAAMLVVTTNAKINAVGTVAQPIVFTSSKPAGQRAPGDWASLNLGGTAPINVADGGQYFGGIDGAAPSFGGTNGGHDCGKLRYVRVEFAFKALVVAGCGSATEIDYVQVHKSKDDGIQVYGGTANMKHLVVSSFGDDALDWEAGWTGKVQFGVFQANAGNNQVEADNGPNVDASVAPQSNPTLYNISAIGTGAAPGLANPQPGLFLRRATAGKFFNTIVMKTADLPFDVSGSESVAFALSGALDVRNSIFWDNSKLGAAFPNETTNNDNGFSEEGFLFDAGVYDAGAGRGNRAVDPLLTDALNLLTPVFKPQAGSPALTGGATPPNDGFFDPTATFVGAIGQADWTTGWVAYPQN
jgi:hypothetical protein